MKELTNVVLLRRFLGSVNQVGKFILHLAVRDKALRDLPTKKYSWLRGVDQDRAFKTLKDALILPPVLALYDPNRDIKVLADASSYKLGGVLLQQLGEGWRLIAYASRSLSPTECDLVTRWACERFCDVLIRKYFCRETDHRPLVSLLGGRALDLLPHWIQRFRLRLIFYA